MTASLRQGNWELAACPQLLHDGEIRPPHSCHDRALNSDASIQSPARYQLRHRASQHVSAAVVRPSHDVEGDPLLLLPPEPMSLEISTPEGLFVCTVSDHCFGVISPKTYPKTAQMLKSQPIVQSRITCERFKIDAKCQCSMNIKSRSPFLILW